MTSGASVKRQVGSDPLERGERHPDDFYRTGAIGTRALLAVERFPGTVWEPACGTGEMAEVLRGPDGRRAGIEKVWSTDLANRGYGIPYVDFLNPKYSDVPPGPDHVITNPPFRLVEEFLERALDVVPLGGKVALIARLQWLEGAGRRERVFARVPPTRVWVFPWRCPMARGDRPMGAGLIAFCWYVWHKGRIGEPTVLGWLPPRSELEPSEEPRDDA